MSFFVGLFFDFEVGLEQRRCEFEMCLLALLSLLSLEFGVWFLCALSLVSGENWKFEQIRGLIELWWV